MNSVLRIAHGHSAQPQRKEDSLPLALSKKPTRRWFPCGDRVRNCLDAFLLGLDHHTLLFRKPDSIVRRGAPARATEIVVELEVEFPVKRFVTPPLEREGN